MKVALSRKRKVVTFLDLAKKDAAPDKLILGDMFDFWYEYKNYVVVPKGLYKVAR